MLRNAFLVSLLAASPAFAVEPAATLSAQEGTVLVNPGDEFITATEAQALQAGDRVMVMAGGRAEITFADGCVLPLPEGSMLDVPAVSTCADATARVQKIGPSFAEAEAGEEAPSERKGVNPYLVGGAVVAVAALLIGGGGGDDDRPVSP